jgi:hypothetical protein
LRIPDRSHSVAPQAAVSLHPDPQRCIGTAQLAVWAHSELHPRPASYGSGGAVGIGEDLAKARRKAGLTVSHVSKQTRIRETIIHEIEHDDYSACGGDFYTRGHIRAIAHVVGADPGPLIADYDATRQASPARAPVEPSQPATAPRIGWLYVLRLKVIRQRSGRNAGPSEGTPGKSRH